MTEPVTAAPPPVRPDGTESLFTDVRRPESHTRSWPRRAAVILLTVVVMIGALGGFGVHSVTVTTQGSGYTFQVHYALIARPGLDVPWRVTVHCPAACPAITIAVTQNYFRIYETQGFQPDTSSTTSDGHDEYLGFTKPPDGSRVFVVDYDAYIQPGSHAGAPARVRLIVGNVTRATLHIHTWLVP